MANFTPTNDIIFKKIFGSKGNEGILKDFLESILDQKIKYLTLGKNTELLPKYVDGKSNRIDIRATLEDKIEVNIEMQVKTEDYREERALHYWGKLYTEVIDKGDEYESARKTICIWIVGGKVYDEFKEYHSKWKIAETKYGISGHFDKLEIHVIELKKFKEADIIKPKKKEFWLWFIANKKKELMDLMELNQVDFEKIREAQRKLNELTADKDVRAMLIQLEMNERDEKMRRNRAIREGREEGLKEGRKEGLKEGRKEGLKKGMEKGIEKGKKETVEIVAKNLKNKNMTIEDIVEITGLTKEEIEKL